VELAGRLFYLMHSVHDLDIKLAQQSVAMAVSGPSRKAKVEAKDRAVSFNPGSAGPRRLSLQITLEFVTIIGGMNASIPEPTFGSFRIVRYASSLPVRFASFPPPG
jgi:uncharacterized protein